MAIDPTKLANGETDLQTLEDVVNGAPDRANPGHPNGTVTARLGRVIKTVSNAVSAIEAVEETATASADIATTQATAAAVARDAAAASAITAAGYAGVSPNGTVQRWLDLLALGSFTASAGTKSDLYELEQALRYTGLLPKIIRLNIRSGDQTGAIRVPFVVRQGVGNVSDTGTLTTSTEATGLTGFKLGTGVTCYAAGQNPYNVGWGMYCLNQPGAGARSAFMGQTADAWGFWPQYAGINAALALTFAYAGRVQGDLTRYIAGATTYPTKGTMAVSRDPAGKGRIFRNGIQLSGNGLDYGIESTIPTDPFFIDTTAAGAAIGADWITDYLNPSEQAMWHNIIHKYQVGRGRGVVAEGL